MKELLWTPSEETVARSNLLDFLRRAETRFHKSFSAYRPLYDWSVEQPEEFWGFLWEYLDILAERPFTRVVDDIAKFPGADWFPGARLNYAENTLRFGDTDASAIVFCGEDRIRRTLTHRELKDAVIRLATYLQSCGVRPGDRVAAYMPNVPETVIAMLAAAAVGAVFCSCATDIGPLAAINRMGQVEPRILFTVDGYYYKGKRFDVLQNAAEIARGIPSLERTIVAHYAGDGLGEIPNAVYWSDAVEKPVDPGFRFPQFPASHPLVVMFSSGTTGKPKCIVQSAAGLLLNQLKELVLHHDVKPADRMLYITTCSWMMWNWQLAALGTGASIVLYDGNPSYPDTGNIWRVLSREEVSVFGLSASYIHGLIAEGFMAADAAPLPRLRCISQTGSALSEAGFHYVYEKIKPDLHFCSIAGGTDINGCFAIGNPLSPVYANELQAPGLGMKINCYDDAGRPIRDAQGQLVCEMPAPPMPLYFWNDPDNKKYLDAYFGVYPGVWRHGDYVSFDSQTGGVTFFGRSDSVLKPSGVRIGTSEIYNQVEKLPEIVDSLAIGQDYHGDQRILLFVQLREGCALDDRLRKEIRSILRTNASPRHVPALILQTPDIPKTLNQKKVESAVTNIINGRAVTNREALANPGSLDYFLEILPLLR